MKLIWVFVSIGGIVGAYLPTLFGVSGLSFWPIFTSALGSFAGIWLYNQLDL